MSGLGDSISNSIGGTDPPRHPAPPWKFGVSPAAMMGGA